MLLVYDNAAQLADLVRAGRRNLQADGALESAVVISLFSDRVAEDLPPADRRGYWADAYSGPAGDRTGSWLWRLGGMGADVRPSAETFAKEALAWLIVDGVAREVRAFAWLEPGTLRLRVEIERPDDRAGPWERVWEVPLHGV